MNDRPKLSRALDTDPRAEAVQIELLQRATPARRFRITMDLSRQMIELSRRALRRARPGASEREIELEWVALTYGEDLAARLARHLADREK